MALFWDKILSAPTDRKFNWGFLLEKLHSCDNHSYTNIPPINLFETTESEPPIYVCKFIPHKSIEYTLLLANEDGCVCFHDTSSNKYIQTGQTFQAHSKCIFDVNFMSHPLSVLTAAGDWSIKLWHINDFKKNTLTLVSRFQGHNGSVKCLDVPSNTQNIFVSGSRDNTIILWDVRSPSKSENHIRKAHHIKGIKLEFRVTSVCSLGEFQLISAADGDGYLNIWDWRRTYSAYHGESIPSFQLNYGGKSYKRGFGALHLSSCNLRLFASCTDSCIYQYDLASLNPHPMFKGHTNNSYYIKTCLSPDSQFILSGSEDNCSYIWDVMKPSDPLIRLEGHRDEVNAVAWCHIDPTKLVTCSDDFTHRIWQIRSSTCCERQNNIGYAVNIAKQRFQPLILPYKYWRNSPITVESPSVHAYFPSVHKSTKSLKHVSVLDWIHHQNSNKLSNFTPQSVKSCNTKSLKKQKNIFTQSILTT